ncbi:MAG: Minf_1886 family protein [Phycisphaerae bacterium]
MNQTTRKSLEQVVAECGRYPIEAFEFVRTGLNYTVQRIHGDTTDMTESQCHVSGQQLSEGLRDFAIRRYGIMAKAVLAHWRIQRTNDFGRIVFAMVESKLMQKTDDDDVRDFDDVFDFRTAFEPPARPRTSGAAVFKL